MIEIVKEFMQLARVMHRDTWKIITLENLLEHCASKVKKIYREGKVSLCYSQARTTESVQLIDVGQGRLIRCNMEWSLDKWLIVEGSIEN